MYEYKMIINDKPYNALFLDHFEAADFLDANDHDGNITIITEVIEMTVEDIIKSHDFEYSYKIEMIGEMVLPNHDFHKTYEVEAELKKLGYL